MDLAGRVLTDIRVVNPKRNRINGHTVCDETKLIFGEICLRIIPGDSVLHLEERNCLDSDSESPQDKNIKYLIGRELTNFKLCFDKDDHCDQVLMCFRNECIGFVLHNGQVHTLFCDHYL